MVTRAKKTSLPNKIDIHDEIGQLWYVYPDDELWQEVLTLTNNGQLDAVLPLATIVSKRGWGWWSCFKTQDDWLKELGIPVPDHHVLDEAAQASATQLTPLLQRYGGYVAFLETQVGLLEGRMGALEQAYKAAIAVHSADIGEKMSEKAKESQILAHNATLKQTRRLQIETEMLYKTAKGMCEGYQRAYEAVSRIVSVRLGEMELQPRGRP